MLFRIIYKVSYKVLQKENSKENTSQKKKKNNADKFTQVNIMLAISVENSKYRTRNSCHNRFRCLFDF